MKKKDLSKIEQDLIRLMGRLVVRHDLIKPDDKVLVAVSGGKDSSVLLHLLSIMQNRVPFRFSLVAGHVDQGLGIDISPLRIWLEKTGIEFVVKEEKHGNILDQKVQPGKTRCALCARLRRGTLRKMAEQVGANKIALGHNREDLIETLLMNALYSGRLQALGPVMPMANRNLTLIRPLALCPESKILELAQDLDLPTLSKPWCEGVAEPTRSQVKALIEQLNNENPRVKGNLLAALQNVWPASFMDLELWEKLGIPSDMGGDEYWKPSFKKPEQQ